MMQAVDLPQIHVVGCIDDESRKDCVGQDVCCGSVAKAREHGRQHLPVVRCHRSRKREHWRPKLQHLHVYNLW